MGQIVILSELLVNKIAAGEVVERPASIVKELMENSLDAGATQISLEVEDGGKKLIRVIDNGCGMDAQDLKLAFTPHATSKISSAEDLFAIATLGFRGEALASIASVAQVEVVSRTAQAIEGSLLAVSGGQFGAVKPAASAVGTAISVQNLFFNTPARRKFLRTTNTELGHITEQFNRIALSHTQVHLSLSHNGRTLYGLPAGQSLRERIGVLFSAELAAELISIQRKDRAVEITGLVAPPRCSRSAAQWQYIFLNRRCIRDRFVSHAIRESFRGMLEANRQPIVFLFLQLPPQQVDVNVHPAKAEVRFADSNMIHSQVLAAIRDQLLQSDLSVPLPADSLRGLSRGPFVADTLPQRGDIHQQQNRVRQAMADFFKSADPPAVRGGQSAYPSAAGGGQSHYPTVAGGGQSAGPQISYPGAVDDRGAGFKPSASAAAEPDYPVKPSESSPAPTGPFMQIHNAYLVCQSDDGLLIIDQHALHERILYENLSQQLSRGPLASQRCLIPEVVDVTPEQMAVIDSQKQVFTQLGIAVEPFGPSSVAVQAFPVLLGKISPADFVAQLLDLLLANSGRVSREQMIHQVLDMTACKAAVKAGDPLNEAEIKNLLAQREIVERSSNCPHGRPTTIKLTLPELEKKFKRT